MPAYDSDLTPVALPSQAVRMVPDNVSYEVKAVEQMGRLGPYDFGAASANSKASEGGSTVIEMDDELEFDNGELGQIWVNPLSDVEIEVRQTGQQDQRLVNSNKVGHITPSTPAPMRQLFVHEDEVPHFIIKNPNEYDLQKTLVYFTGYKFVLGDSPLTGQQVNGLAGTPATVPVDSLKQNKVK